MSRGSISAPKTTPSSPVWTATRHQHRHFSGTRLECARSFEASSGGDGAQGAVPAGVDYRIIYDTTMFVREAIFSVMETIIEAFLLVVFVVLVFLQSWRSTLIPIMAVPVSLIGTFAVMLAFGFSLNLLTLLGLVLAIGIVVDDAIVVVEAVEHHMAEGLARREATIKAMSEVAGPIVAITTVLSCVFIPTAFLPGLTGSFYRQFALTIAFSTILSMVNSLTLSPAMCALFLQAPKERKTSWASTRRVLGWFFRLFNRTFEGFKAIYIRILGSSYAGAFSFSWFTADCWF